MIFCVIKADMLLIEKKNQTLVISRNRLNRKQTLCRKIPLRDIYFEKKTGLQRGLDSGFFFGGHWDPNEHIPTGFALILIISQIAFFGASLPPVSGPKQSDMFFNAPYVINEAKTQKQIIFR